MSATKRALWATAYVQAARAVIAADLGHPAPNLSLVSGGAEEGRNGKENKAGPIEIDEAILASLAGPAAQQRLGTPSWQSARLSLELARARRLTRTRSGDGPEGDRDLDHMWQVVQRMLDDRWAAVEQMAERLVSEGHVASAVVGAAVDHADEITTERRPPARSRRSAPKQDGRASRSGGDRA